jgi:hypothetical protein
MAQQYFYDGQIRRFVIQFIRAVSNFEVEFGKDRNGTRTLQRIPVYYGDASRQAQTILRNNSENIMNAVPAMSAYISALTYEQSRMQEPNFVSKMHLRERRFDPETGLYDTQQGDAYTVERLMPVPYKLTIKLDIWTSNTEQKMQIIEQIATLFNPSLEIQSTDNYIDWTSLTFVQLSDVNWTSRTVPSGAEEPIDIATMTFEMPIWISSPAKVKKLGVIQKVIASIYDEQGAFDENTILSNLIAKVKYTPMNYGIYYAGNQLKLLKPHEIAEDDGTLHVTDPVNNWQALIEVYGTLRTGQTEIRLELPTGNELIGHVTYHPSDPTVLLFTAIEDSMPSNTLDSIDAIINPQNVDYDSVLSTPTSGTRYLLTDSIGSQVNTGGYSAWGDLVANANDIIEYNAFLASWSVVWDSESQTNLEYVTNNNTNIQYRWTGSAWVKSVEGVYRGGEWSIVI